VTVQKFNHVGARVLVTGVSGTGKTELFWRIVSGEKARVKFIFDHQGEFSPRFGLPATVDMEGYYRGAAIGGTVCFDPLKLANEQDGEGERLGIGGAFRVFCELVFAVSEKIKGRKILICDELQKITGTSGNPGEVLNVLETGRRFQLDFFCISQAPNRIHNGIRNQFTRAYSFRQADKNALDYLRDNGFDENVIRGLPNGKYVWRDFQSGEAGTGGKAF